MPGPRSRPSVAIRRALGALIRAHREQARLSVAKVAKRARIADHTLHGLEAGRCWPRRLTLLRLLSVAELRLTWADLDQINRDAELAPQPAAEAMPPQTHAAEAAFTALASPRPGHMAIYRWLPLSWEPGRESLEIQRLTAYLRADGWTLLSEETIGDPVAGTLYLFRRRDAEDSLRADLR